MPKETQEKQQVLDELTDMFYEVCPDEEDEETADTVEHIETLLDDASTPIEKKIKALSAFNNEWFPDGLSVDEQAAYRSLLLKANVFNS